MKWSRAEVHQGTISVTLLRALKPEFAQSIFVLNSDPEYPKTRQRDIVTGDIVTGDIVTVCHGNSVLTGMDTFFAF